MVEIKERPKPAIPVKKVFPVSRRVSRKKSPLSLQDKVMGLLKNPEDTWRQIAQEQGDLADVLWPYALVICALPPLVTAILDKAFWNALILEYSIAALGLGGIFLKVGLGIGIGLVLTLLLAQAIAWGAPRLGVKPSPVLACRWIIYGATPFGLSILADWIPFAGLVVPIIGLGWSALLWIRGWPLVMKNSI